MTLTSAALSCRAFGHGAHAVADLQADVPEERQQPLDRAALRAVRRARHQQQDVDVRAEVQLAAAVAAHGDQRPVTIIGAIECARQDSRSTASMSAARACTSVSTGSSARKRAFSSSCAWRSSSRGRRQGSPVSRRAAPAGAAASGQPGSAGGAGSASSRRSASPAAMADSVHRPVGGREREHLVPLPGDQAPCAPTAPRASGPW